MVHDHLGKRCKMTIITVTSEKQPRLQAGSVVTSNYDQIPNPSVMNVGVKDTAPVVGIAAHHSQSQILDSQQNVDPSRMGICVAGVATVNPMVLGAAAPIPIGVRLQPEFDSGKDRVLLKRARDENEHHFRCRSLGVRRRISGKVIVESSSFPITKDSVARGERPRAAASLERSSESTSLEARKNQVEITRPDLKGRFDREYARNQELMEQVSDGQTNKEVSLKTSISRRKRDISKADESDEGVLVKYYYPIWNQKAQAVFDAIEQEAKREWTEQDKNFQKRFQESLDMGDPKQIRKDLTNLKAAIIQDDLQPKNAKNDTKATVAKEHIRQWIDKIDVQLKQLDGTKQGKRAMTPPPQPQQQPQQSQSDSGDAAGSSTSASSQPSDDPSLEEFIEKDEEVRKTVQKALDDDEYSLPDLKEALDDITQAKETQTDPEKLGYLNLWQTQLAAVLSELEQREAEFYATKQSELEIWLSSFTNDDKLNLLESEVMLE